MNIKHIYEKYYLNSSGIIIDSRKVKKGSIFIALRGNKYDGNQFVMQAIEKGAIITILDNKKYYDKNNKNMHLVKNTFIFLQDLSRYHRYINMHIPIIAITGSNGKTTTKTLISLILSTKYSLVHATKENFNNHIGVPLTILSMHRNTQFAIIEIGISNFYEMKYICEIINPDYGYITNFGKTHLEGLKNIQGVIREKSKLYEFLRKNKKFVFINGDDYNQVTLSKNINKFIFSGNKKNKANLYFKYYFNSYGSNLKKSFLVYKKKMIFSHMIGEYNLYNIAAAITIGIYFGINIKNIKNAVEKYYPNNFRSQILKKNNINIIIDCYNANPTSMIKSLNFFLNYIKGKKAIILGDMLELGVFSEYEHQNIVNLLIKHKELIKVYLIGKNFFNIKYNYINFKKFIIITDFIKFIKQHPIKKIDFIFIKGSRKMELENIIQFI